MRIGRPGLWTLLTLVTACGTKPPVETPPVETPPTEKPPTKYQVGGTLSGLAGSLTLSLNGQENLPRTANGPFAFETRVADQASYAVSVTTPPPEQDCTVEGGTGKVSGADVNSVRVTCATRTYTLGGSVEGLDGTLELSLGGETLRLGASGPFVFTTRLTRGQTYAVTLGATPSGQRCALSGASGTVAGNVDTLAVRCVYWYALDTFQAANGLLGQADFTRRQPDRGGASGAGTLNNPQGNAVFAGGRLYVPDTASNRVLGFEGLPTSLGASASLVVGQPDLETTPSGSGEAGLGTPEGLSSDGTWLAVADTRNSRVLLYSALPSSSTPSAARVVGQQGFAPRDPTTGEPGDTGAGCTEDALSFPEDVFLGRGKLLVADTGNHRVLVWNGLPATHGAPADLVLGQQYFTHCTANDADSDGKRDATCSASTLWHPTGVWTDGTRLVVVNGYNNRVLVWNTFPTRNGQPADNVLGQPDFGSRGAGLSATALNTPTTVTSTGLQLFVSDNANHRVLVWNSLPSSPGAPADVVLGQRDFTHADINDPTSGSAPSASSLSSPSGILLAGPRVWVSDYGNNRMLVFTSH